MPRILYQSFLVTARSSSTAVMRFALEVPFSECQKASISCCDCAHKRSHSCTTSACDVILSICSKTTSHSFAKTFYENKI